MTLTPSTGPGLHDLLRAPLAIVDLETTGGRPGSDRITEVAIITVDADGVRRWSTLVNPGCHIPVFITRLTGISPDMVADAPAFAEIADEVWRRLEGHLFIAHNARFDYGFLKAEFERLGRPFQLRSLCTVRVARALAPEAPRHSLDAVMARYGLSAQQRHRALDDAQVVLDFLLRARAAHGDEALAAAAGEVRKRPSLPPYLDEALVETLPTGPGVYFFHGEAGLLYVGKARNIRQRVLSHFSADATGAKAVRLSQQVRRITWEETAGELGALLREAQRVKQLQPLHNRQLRRQGALLSISLREDARGLLQPVPVQGDALVAGGRLHGLFPSRAAITRLLRELAAREGLCDYALGLARPAPRPCPSRQLKRCHGLCEGVDTPVKHNLRLLQALGAHALKAWPYAGPVVYVEPGVRAGEGEWHLLDNWCWLGSARDEAELAGLLAARDEATPVLDRDTYRLLVSAVLRHPERVRPLVSSTGDARLICA